MSSNPTVRTAGDRNRGRPIILPIRDIVGCGPSCKRLSQIRTGCADQRLDGSVRGAASNGLFLPCSPITFVVRRG